MLASSVPTLPQLRPVIVWWSTLFRPRLGACDSVLASTRGAAANFFGSCPRLSLMTRPRCAVDQRHGSGRRNGLSGRTKKLDSELWQQDVDQQNGTRGSFRFPPDRRHQKRTTDVLRKPDNCKSYRQILESEDCPSLSLRPRMVAYTR